MEFPRTRLKAGVAGGALLAALAAGRWLASADGSAVYVAGGELPVVCPVRLLLGIPCPGCGMTRSVVMTLGGDLRGALSANPAGPLLAAALALLGAQLLVSALRPGPEAEAQRLLPWASAYAAVVASVMLIQWVGGLVGA